MRRDEPLGRLAKRQWGVFSREQVFQLGFSRWAIQRRLDCGDWDEVERGVYRFRGCPDTWRHRVRAGTLSLGAGACASHRSAGFLYGLDGLGMPTQLELTVPRACRRELWTGLIYRPHAGAGKPSWRERIPVTSLVKTVIDLASVLGEEDCELVLDSAMRKSPGFRAWLERELPAVAGRPGVPQLVRLLAVRGKTRTDSWLEVKAWRALRRAKLPAPKLGLRFRNLIGLEVVRPDFCWPELKIAVFTDGRGTHSNGPDFERDARQGNHLAALGWAVLRVTRAMVLSGGWIRVLGPLLSERQRAKKARCEFGAERAHVRISRPLSFGTGSGR